MAAGSGKARLGRMDTGRRCSPRPAARRLSRIASPTPWRSVECPTDSMSATTATIADAVGRATCSLVPAETTCRTRCGRGECQAGTARRKSASTAIRSRPRTRTESRTAVAGAGNAIAGTVESPITERRCTMPRSRSTCGSLSGTKRPPSLGKPDQLEWSAGVTRTRREGERQGVGMSPKAIGPRHVAPDLAPLSAPRP